MAKVSLAKPLSDFLRLLHANRGRAEPAIDVFADLFSIDRSRQLDVVVQLTHVVAAIDKLRQQVHLLEDWDDELRLSTLGSLDKIYKIFNVTTFASNFGSLISVVSDSDLVMLSLLDKTLSHKHPTPRISDAEIAQLQQKIDELASEIRDSGLGKQAKMLFAEHLARLRIAFDQYKYFGVDGAWRVLGLMTVDLARQTHVEPIENRGILIRARSLGKAVLKVLSLADQVNSGVQAIENLSSRLPGGS